MRKRLIILSDLWGKEKSNWIKTYTQSLKNHFEIRYYDCCELGEVDKSIYTEEKLHKQFVNGGIDNAVQKLIDLEKDNVNVLAFSIGGVIAWKFGIISKKTDSLYCVSSTRLRHETVKPNGEIRLYFGEKDTFRPQKEWFTKLNLTCELVREQEHKLYTQSEFAEQLTNQILKQTN